MPDIVMNATEMGQVFVNLFSNAIEASKPGDCVTVRVASTSEEIQIAFHDRGSGMTDEEIDRMFDPFYTSRADQGAAGLGLSITYGIVRQHGGKIDVRSRPGRRHGHHDPTALGRGLTHRGPGEGRGGISRSASGRVAGGVPPHRDRRVDRQHGRHPPTAHAAGAGPRPAHRPPARLPRNRSR